jgi:alpha-L-rhamnosidase
MKKSIAIFTLLLLSVVGFSQTRVVELLCNNLSNPIEVGTSPQFSWQLISPKRNVLQTAYEIKVLSGKSSVWNPGKVS